MKDVLQTVISQYSNSERIKNVILLSNSVISTDDDLINFNKNIANIETAKGVFLDTWGRIVGISRTYEVSAPSSGLGFFGSGLEGFNINPFGTDKSSVTISIKDEFYRKAILAKARANISNCSVKDNIDILKIAIEDYEIYINDTGNMEFLVTISGSGFGSGFGSGSDIRYVIENIINRPSGVKINTVFIEGIYFGFSGSGMNPFDQSIFHR